MVAQNLNVKTIGETSVNHAETGVGFRVCFVVSAGKVGLELSGLGCR